MTGSEDDYWTQEIVTDAVALRDPSASFLRVQTIEGVEPLDDQFGVAQPLTVPPALRDALFGQPELIEGSAILPLHTYAILDAAKVPGLPEMLEVSGLDYACLYQGDALSEFGETAPWIVRLAETNAFTRKLFTRGEMLWDLWDREPGFYLRSRTALDALRRHFRRFVKVRNTAGQLVFFRFWEPLVAQAYLDCATTEHPESLALLGHPDELLISAVVTCPVWGAVQVHGCDAIPMNLTDGAGAQLTSVQENALARALERKRRGDVGLALRKGFPDETIGLEDADLSHLVDDVVMRMGSYGIRKVRSIHLIASWQIFYGPAFETRDPDGTLLRICQAQGNEETKVKHMQVRLSALHGAGLL